MLTPSLSGSGLHRRNPSTQNVGSARAISAATNKSVQAGTGEIRHPNPVDGDRAVDDGTSFRSPLHDRNDPLPAKSGPQALGIEHVQRDKISERAGSRVAHDLALVGLRPVARRRRTGRRGQHERRELEQQRQLERERDFEQRLGQQLRLQRELGQQRCDRRRRRSRSSMTPASAMPTQRRAVVSPPMPAMPEMPSPPSTTPGPGTTPRARTSRPTGAGSSRSAIPGTGSAKTRP